MTDDLTDASRAQWLLKQRLARNPEQRRAARERDGDMCRHCGQHVDFADRTGPLGGTYELVDGELVVACRGCNVRAAARTRDNSRTVKASLTGDTPQDLSWIGASKWAGSIDMSQQLAESLATTPPWLPGLSEPHSADEFDRYRQHSIWLNMVAWNINRVLGHIPADATEYEGRHIVDELPYICALIRVGLGAPGSVWAELVAERHSAHLKHGTTSMESCDRFADRRLRILTEELGEVARVLNDREPDMQPGKPQEWYADAEDHHLLELRGELVQLAAMAVAWIAALDGEALA